MGRNLVTFRTVQEIRPMDADKLELALIDGWQVVVNKGDFTIGAVGTYFEVDSFLPERPWFEFLRASSFRQMGDDVGFRLRTIRLRKELSQGLLLPPALLGLTGNEDDLAERLGVKLWDPPIPAQLAGTVMGKFPTFIPKTDQERVQNLTGKLWGTGRTITYTDAEGLEVTKELPKATKRQYDVSEKLDGCFHHSTLINTDQGKLRIGSIVCQKLPVNVLTYNEDTKKAEYKEIEQYHHYKDKHVDCVVSVGHRGKGNRAKQIKCTQDHLFLTERGWIEAGKLQAGDIVFHKCETLPYESKQLLLGCLLGDSYLRVKDTYVSITFGHSEKQQEYIDYKKKILGDLYLDSIPKMGGYEGSTLISRGHTKTNLAVNSVVLPLCYNTETQTTEVSEEWAKSLNPIALAFWYMDDGSIRGRLDDKQQPTATLHTQAYSYREVGYLRDRLLQFGVDAEIGDKDVYTGHVLRMNLQASDIFFSLIAPYVPSCMRYKLPIKYDSYLCTLENIKSDYFLGVTPTKVLNVSFDVKDCYRHYPGSYDLTLKDNHNYFVYDILVHNSSMTVYDHEDTFGVCSRNLDLKEDESNSFWKVANRYNLRERLKGRELAFQGELVGEGIQANPYRLKDQDFYVYNIYDITRRMYLSPEDRLGLLARDFPDVKTVPLIARHFELPATLGELLGFVQGKSALNPQKEREGLVFKEEGESINHFSFKGISNSYLLKQKD